MSERGPAVALTESEQRRIREIHSMHNRGVEAVSTLIEMLSDESWTVRREVVSALTALGDPAVQVLCAVLKSRRDSEARLAAAVDALSSTSADVFPAVAELSRESNSAIVADAAQILGRRRSTRAVPLLTELVNHRDDNVSVAAIEALGRIGGRASVDTLIAAVKSGNFFRTFPAIDVLGRSGDPRVIAPLASLLSEPTYALEAARALGRTGEPAAVAPLASLLSHPSENTVRIAGVALCELFSRYRERYGNWEGVEAALQKARPGPPAVRRLVQSLANADRSEQVSVSFVLGTLGGDVAAVGLARLLDSSGAPAEAAANALKRMGRDSDAQIREALRSGGSIRRSALLPVVTRSIAVPEIIECLKDEDPAVRSLACDALARLGAVGAVAALFSLLEDQNPRVVQSALAAIQSLGSVETQSLALKAGLHSNPQVRRAAFRILAYFGINEALPLFLEGMQDADARVRDAAIAGLAFLDVPEALDVLVEAARAPAHATRSAAMRALGQVSKRDARIPAALLRGLGDPDAWVRYFAIQALGRLGVQSATDALVPFLSDDAGQVRVAAVEALSHFENDAALEALCRTAEGDEPDVQRAALLGLGAMKRLKAFPVLVRAAQSTDPATRLVAISAIADSTSSHVLPTLAKAVRDSDDNVRSAALGFIAAVPAVEATGLLIDLLKESKDSTRVSELLAIPNEGRVPGILAALETADDDLAPLLTSALVRMRIPEGRQALFKVLSAYPVPARKAAATALASLGAQDALQALQHCAETDPDERVRQTCSILVGE